MLYAILAYHVETEVQSWTPAEDALLGKLPDAEVARRTGRTLLAVRMHRYLKGIPAPRRQSQ